jgi:phosphoribosylaminoimidazolecarboxamide formyltransferase/IMP cyclohydrolase
MAGKRALLSVFDKTGIVDFAKGLEKLGYEIVSTGGTARTLREAGVAAVDVSDITGFPECLDGRVKTLHPLIHAGILGMRGNPKHVAQMQELQVTPIDVVAINLYPFKQTILKDGVTLEDAIENIDIGGPTMIRAAAKNWQDVAVVVDPADYDTVLAGLSQGGLARDEHFRLAAKVFEHTAAYDTLIANYLRGQLKEASLFPERLSLTYEKVQEMRYGENPHQLAAFYREVGKPGYTLADAKQLHGKALSYNNINDANGALDVIKELPTDKPCAVAIKHANPCGVALGDTLLDAYTKAHDADPVSIFGGIVALNREVDEPTAQKLSEIFLEIIIAPAYSEVALKILTEKKNIRLLLLPGLQTPNTAAMMDMKKVAGGMLVQELDSVQIAEGQELKVATKRAPTDDEMQQLQLAWQVVKHVKSNAICLVRDNRTVGIGPGQPNRVTALDLAVAHAGELAAGSVMASDAFFPFSDTVEHAAKHGITAIIQPGGSVRDEESIKACDDAGIAMVFTGTRHFKH